MTNYYLCNYSVRGAPCCFVGDSIKNISRIIKYCIENHGWSLGDRIDVLPEEDVLEPGGFIIGHKVTNDDFTRSDTL